jgi:hypothetical protein
MRNTLLTSALLIGGALSTLAQAETFWKRVDDTSADLAAEGTYLISSSSHVDRDGFTQIVTFWRYKVVIVRCVDTLVPSPGKEVSVCYAAVSIGTGETQ